MRDRKATRSIRAIAERQHGIVTRRQLIELGAGRRLIQTRLEGGLLVPLYRGVFALGHGRTSLNGRWLAAVLACGPGAVLSHGSASQLWGLRRFQGPIEVTRRSGGSRRPGIRLHQTRRLGPDEVTEEAGIPVTSIERALLDIAPRLDTRGLEHVLVSADRSGRLRWPALDRVLEQGAGRRASARLREVAGSVDPRAADAISPLEVDFLALCREARLPLPNVNVLVEGHLVDFLWPAERVVVETDGYRYHRDRLAFEHDHEVTVDLEAAGYRVHRTTYRMLRQDSDRFLANVLESFRQRTASPLPPARGQR
jgi:Protein of unknown function (DUF559)